MRSGMAAMFAVLWLATLAVAHAGEPFSGPASDHHGAVLRAVPIGTSKALVLVPAAPASGLPWMLASSLYTLDSAPVANMTRAQLQLVAVDYRFIAQANAEGLVPPVRGPMHDVARALQFVRSKAAEWGLRKDRIGVTGSSAGGCSSLWLAFHPDMADATSPDPVARESTRPYCAAAEGPQTTLDPRQMKDWTPNSTYGGHAFGVKGGFAAFLEQRESLLPWIAEYSPYALATADAPPVYLYFGDAPNPGHEQKDPTHTANFGVKLQERLRELNVPCELVYPGAPGVSHAGVSDYLIAQLSAGPQTEPK